MTWRERIAAARERGSFTQEDLNRAEMYTTCAVGECVTPLGKTHSWFVSQPEYVTGSISGEFTWAVRNNLFDEAEAALESAEDFTLWLKREGRV